MAFGSFGRSSLAGVDVNGVSILLELSLDWIEKTDDPLVLLELLEGVLFSSERLEFEELSPRRKTLSPCGIVSVDVWDSDIDVDPLTVSVPPLIGVVTPSILTTL